MLRIETLSFSFFSMYNILKEEEIFDKIVNIYWDYLHIQCFAIYL